MADRIKLLKAISYYRKKIPESIIPKKRTRDMTTEELRELKLFMKTKVTKKNKVEVEVQNKASKTELINVFNAMYKDYVLDTGKSPSDGVRKVSSEMSKQEINNEIDKLQDLLNKILDNPDLVRFNTKVSDDQLERLLTVIGFHGKGKPTRLGISLLMMKMGSQMDGNTIHTDDEIVEVIFTTLFDPSSNTFFVPENLFGDKIEDFNTEETGYRYDYAQIIVDMTIDVLTTSVLPEFGGNVNIVKISSDGTLGTKFQTEKPEIISEMILPPVPKINRRKQASPKRRNQCTNICQEVLISLREIENKIKNLN